MAAGVWVASGREIPPGSLLVKPPSEVVMGVWHDADGAPQALLDGAVAPIPPQSSG